MQKGLTSHKALLTNFNHDQFQAFNQWENKQTQLSVEAEWENMSNMNDHLKVDPEPEKIVYYVCTEQSKAKRNELL